MFAVALSNPRSDIVALYMVVERFRDAGAVYRRFQERGRLAPPGLDYVSSWITDDVSTCYQLMETQEPALLDEWISHWSDLVDFEVRPVITSQQAAQRVGVAASGAQETTKAE